MRNILPALCLSYASAIAAGPSEGFRLGTAEWSVPRDGEVVVRMPAVKDAVSELLSRPDGMLEIRYPGGDEGVLWARELRAWLVALGVASRQIELVPGSGAEQAVRLRVVPQSGGGDWRDKVEEEKR